MLSSNATKVGRRERKTNHLHCCQEHHPETYLPQEFNEAHTYSTFAVEPLFTCCTLPVDKSNGEMWL